MRDTYIKEEGIVIQHCIKDIKNLMDHLIRLGSTIHLNTGATETKFSEIKGNGIEIEFNIRGKPKK